jgi:hypothetical protein
MDYDNSPTLPELAARKWPGNKKMQVKVIEICTTLKKKRLKDDFNVDLKRMSDVSMVTQEQCMEVISWYEEQLLDTKFVII